MVSGFSIWMRYCGCTVMLVFLIGNRLISIKETETVLGSTHGNLTPPRISPSCSIGTGVPTLVLSPQGKLPQSALWTNGPAPYLTCCIDADVPHRQILAHSPMSLPILCLYRAHQRMYFRFDVQFSRCGKERTFILFTLKPPVSP